MNLILSYLLAPKILRNIAVKTIQNMIKTIHYMISRLEQWKQPYIVAMIFCNLFSKDSRSRITTISNNKKKRKQLQQQCIYERKIKTKNKKLQKIP